MGEPEIILHEDNERLLVSAVNDGITAGIITAKGLHSLKVSTREKGYELTSSVDKHFSVIGTNDRDENEGNRRWKTSSDGWPTRGVGMHHPEGEGDIHLCHVGRSPDIEKHVMVVGTIITDNDNIVLL